MRILLSYLFIIKPDARDELIWPTDLYYVNTAHTSRIITATTTISRTSNPYASPGPEDTHTSEAISRTASDRPRLQEDQCARCVIEASQRRLTRLGSAFPLQKHLRRFSGQTSSESLFLSQQHSHCSADIRYSTQYQRNASIESVSRVKSQPRD